jgi:Bacterial Ig-like domain (group 3)
MHLSSRRSLTAAAILLGLGLSVQAQAGVANTSVGLTVLPNPASVGQQVTLTATVTGTGVCTEPTGTVTFVNGAAEIVAAGNPATLTPGTPISTAILQTTLPLGENLITANYSGAVSCSPGSALGLEDIINALPTVPTLAEWGKIGFAGLLLLGGVGVLARRARNNGAR